MTESDPAGDSFSLSARARIHKSCDAFELAFTRDTRPKIEDYVKEAVEPERSRLFRELLLLECELRQRLGENPHPDDYVQRFSEHEELVRASLNEFKQEQETRSLPENNDDTKPGSDAEEQPPRIERYQIRRKLGAGAFGFVYLARDVELDRLVALKVARPDRPVDADRFLVEARHAAKLSHPNIVAVHDTGRLGDGRPFVVMQYIEGGTLAHELGRVQGDWSTTVEIMRQVADALQHAHRQGLVHRDLKPSNILTDKSGRHYVADFGLALHEDDQGKYRGDRSGTPHYRSPEQVRGEADWIDGRSDIWALGAILYQLLVGRRPFQGASVDELDEEILRREPKPPRQINESVPEWLEEICLKSLSKSPDARYATADSLSKALAAGGAAASPTSIQIGQDATGNTIVTVDGNVVIVQAGKTFNEAAEPTSSAPLGKNPYKGLAAFDEQDADVFFGRERQVERLWELLRDLRTRTSVNRSTVRMLPILGPSGCGKSSVARAGLISELARKPLPGSKDCRVVVLTPGTRPVESLAVVLARTVTGEPAPFQKAREFEAELRRPNEQGDYDGLRRVVNMLPDRSSSPVFLLIDQFEEIYSLCDSAEERRIFIQQLLNAAKDPTGHVSVIITLRSDFIGATHDHQELNQIVAERGVLIPAMNEDELRQAIKRPAEEAGFVFKENILTRLIDATRDREGALPLLQFALTQIWRGIQAEQDPGTTLQEIGGVGGALAGEAQRVYESLPTADQKIAQRAFLAMVQIGEGTRDTRRRANVKSMATKHDDADHIHSVLSFFASPDTRLVTLRAGVDGEYEAEVTHEALFEHWPQLRQWLDVSRDDIRFHRRVDAAARDWNERGRPAGLLWRTPDLDLLREFANDELTQLQAEFFQASDEQEQAEERGRQRRTRIYRIGSGMILVLAIVASVFGWRATQATSLAKANEVKALENEKLAIGNEELAIKQSDVAVESMETLAKNLPRILQLLPADQAKTIRLDLLNTTIQSFRDVTEQNPRRSYVAAAAHRGIGDIYLEAGSPERAIDEYEKSLGFVEQRRDARVKTSWEDWENLGRVEDLIGEAYLANSDLSNAKKHFDQALEFRQAWRTSGEHVERAEYEIGASYGNLGRVLFRDESKYAEALQLFKKSVQRRKVFLDANADMEKPQLLQREYGGALRYVGIAKRGLGRYEEAVKDLETSQTILSDVLKAWQEEPGLQGEYLLEINVATGFTEIGQTYLMWGRMDQAVADFKEAEKWLRRMHEEMPRDTEVTRAFWKPLYALATCLIDSDPERAAELFSEANSLFDKTKFSIVLAMLTKARVHDRATAEEYAQKITAAKPDDGTNLYYAACGLALCAWSARTQAARDDAGLASEAERYTNLALDQVRVAIEKGYANYSELRANPELDAIRDDPRFSVLLGRIAPESQ